MLRVVGIAFKITLLAAVLFQYSPLRVCVFEKVMTGASCHDRSHDEQSVGHGAGNESHEDALTLPGETDPHDSCACDQPKFVNQQVGSQQVAVDCIAVAVEFATFHIGVSTGSATTPPCSSPPPAVARSLPLLI